MAGHSKWANIKHRKAAQDAKRGKLWTKLIREVTVSARLGGGEIADNPRLRAAVDKALAGNMPKDTIDRAIAARRRWPRRRQRRGARTTKATVRVASPILIEAMTDNRNRTVAEVRHAFSKHGGNLGTDGSVAYLCSPVRASSASHLGADEEAIMEAALELGAEDIESEEDGAIMVIDTRGRKPLGRHRRPQGREGLDARQRSDVSMVPANLHRECDADTAATRYSA